MNRKHVTKLETSLAITKSSVMCHVYAFIVSFLSLNSEIIAILPSYMAQNGSSQESSQATALMWRCEISTYNSVEWSFWIETTRPGERKVKSAKTRNTVFDYMYPLCLQRGLFRSHLNDWHNHFSGLRNDTVYQYVDLLSMLVKGDDI